MFLSMVNKVILARLLGPEFLGIYTILLKICNEAAMVAQLGTKTSIVKMTAIAAGAREWAKLKGILYCTARIIALSSVLTVIFIWTVKQPLALKVFNSPELYQVMIFCVVIIPLLNYSTLIEEAFRGLQNLKVASLLPVLQQSAICLMLICLGYNLIATVPNVLIAFCTGLTLSLVVGVYLMYRLTRTWAKAQQVKIKSILAESLPMMVTSGALLVITSTDIYVLGIFTDPATVGIYAVVHSLATMTVLSLGVINQVIPAMIAHYNAQKDFAALTYVVRYASTIGAIFSFPVLILLVFWGKPVLTMLFGLDYAIGATALTFLVICQLVRVITGPCGYVMQMTGLHVTFMKISLVSGLLNLVLNITMVQRFGLEGVAAATALALIFQNCTAMIMVYHKTGIWTFASLEITKEIVNQIRRRICTLLSR